jgi:hypothetical protein
MFRAIPALFSISGQFGQTTYQQQSGGETMLTQRSAARKWSTKRSKERKTRVAESGVTSAPPVSSHAYFALFFLLITTVSEPHLKSQVLTWKKHKPK